MNVISRVFKEGLIDRNIGCSDIHIGLWRLNFLVLEWLDHSSRWFPTLDPVMRATLGYVLSVQVQFVIDLVLTERLVDFWPFLVDLGVVNILMCIETDV